jgi:[ribosomal protein S5]-alanine N-acetyltransferase
MSIDCGKVQACMNRAQVETDRLRLPPWDEAHGPLLAELSSDPRVVRHIALGEPWQASFAREVSERQRGHWIEHGFGWRALVRKTTEEAIGFAALNFLGDGAVGLEADEFEIGWWLSPSAWGKGFAVEGGRAMLTEAFGRIEAPSVVARIQPSNAPSIRVASALGLRHEVSTTGTCGEAVGIYRLTAEAFEP